jgi:signal transduction histidine kinase
MTLNAPRSSKPSKSKGAMSRRHAAAVVTGVFFAFYAPSAWAVNEVMGGQPNSFGYWALLLVAGASVALAIMITGWMVRNRLLEEQKVARLRGRLADAEGQLYWAESILAVEPQVVLVWASERLEGLDDDSDYGEDDELLPSALLEGPEDMKADPPPSVPFSPLGKPHILGSPKALGSVLGISGPVEPGAKSGSGVSIFDLFLSGLHRHDKSKLVAAVQDLKSDGTTFSLEVATPGGKAFLAEGRPAGGKAVVWLRDVSEEGRQISALTRKLDEFQAEHVSLTGLLDALPFPIWKRSATLGIEWANKAYVRAVEEPDLAAVVDKKLELDHSGKQLAGQAVENLDIVSERRYVVVGGQRRALDFVELPQEEGTVGIALDASELDSAENDLQRHIDAHGETLNTLKTAVAIFSSEKRLVFHNRAYLELWHLDEGWLDTNPVEAEILERLRENSRIPEKADFPAWKKKRLDLYSNLISQKDEMWHLPDGRTLRVILQPHPFGGLISLYEDVTDLVTLESNYNQLINVQSETLDHLYDGVAVFGADGRLRLYNAAFTRIWGLSAEHLEGQPHFDKIAEWCGEQIDDRDTWVQLRNRITSGDAERKTTTGQMDRLDGAIVSYGVVPLPDGAVLCTFLDVTDTIQIERALRERNEALETADKLKSEFVNHVSYQLRTPLNSIIGFAGMLDQKLLGDLNEKQGEYVGDILDASDQLLGLINDIIDLAAIEAGGMTLDVQEVDLGQVLEAAVGLLQKKALDNNLTLRLDPPGDVGKIYADERRLKQILFNLLSNAVHFTKEGGSVTLGASRHGRDVAIWVEDTGSGIDPKYQASVFDRFENTGGEGKRGAGLGLSLVKSFVELHGGWVSLESEVDKGTKVTCHIADRAQQNAAE